jgi:hypothetical protein
MVVASRLKVWATRYRAFASALSSKRKTPTDQFYFAGFEAGRRQHGRPNGFSAPAWRASIRGSFAQCELSGRSTELLIRGRSYMRACPGSAAST